MCGTKCTWTCVNIAVDRSNAQIEIHVLLQITDLVRDSPLRDLGVVLSQCAHMVVPRDDQDDSFEYDPEEFYIEKEKDGDSDESDEDYVPEGGSGGSGESGGEGGEIQKEGMGKIQKEGR